MRSARSMVAQTKSVRRVLVMSSARTSVRTVSGDRVPVDLSLRSAGKSYKPKRAAVPVDVSQDPSAGVEFPDQDFAVGVDTTSTAPPQADAGQVFFANVATDSDYSVRVQPTGAESFFQLRSERSPETFRLKVKVPRGGSLAKAVAEHPIPNDPPSAIAILDKDGSQVGFVSSAQTIDSAGKAVDTSTRIVGKAIVIKVTHHQKDLTYPLLVDPQYYTQSAGCSSGFSGWRFAQNIVGYQGTGAYFGMANCVPAYAPGLYESMPTNSGFFNGQYANYLFQAPAGSYIQDAVFGNVGHNDAVNPPPSYYYSGVQSPSLTGGYYANLSAYNTVNGLTFGNPLVTGSVFSGQILDACFTPRCADGGANEGDYATLGLKPNVNQFTFANNPSTTMGYANVALGDSHPPALTSPKPADVAWTDDHAGTHSRSVSMSDTGLGAYALALTGAKDGFQNRFSACNYSPGPGQAPCPPSFSASFDYTLDEGTNTLSFGANDLVANNAIGQTWTERIDRSAPTIGFSGALYDGRNAYVGTNDPVTVDVTATDGTLTPDSAQRSGATALTVTLDDGQPLDGGAVTQTCTRPEGSCPLTADVTLTPDELAALDPGDHTISATATDALGHTTSQPATFTFKLDNVAPTVALDGLLESLRGRVLTDNAYQLTANATENQPTSFEPNDDDTTQMPDFTTPGAGLRDLIFRLDGTQVTTTPTDCFNGSACDSARTWNWDLAATNVANGTHTITVTATDNVDNQEVDSIVVDVQRGGDEPARIDPIKRTLIGTGPNDRVGASVAAIGDVDEDGHADYLVGAPGDSTGGAANSGAVYMVLGDGESGPVRLAGGGASVRAIRGAPAAAFCGTSVASVGDVNGDDLDDFAIGCPGQDTTGLGSLSETTGRVYVIFGRRDPQDIDLASLGSAGFVVTGPRDPGSLGIPLISSRAAAFGERLQSVPKASRTSTDVNGDGLSDLVIGDSQATVGQHALAGKAYVVYGKESSQPVDVTDLGSAGFSIDGANTSGLTGYAAALVHDVNGDALADVVVGSPTTSVPLLDGQGVLGRADVVYGTPVPTDIDLATPSAAYVTLTDGVPGDRFGASASGLADTNLDGPDDLVIGTNSGAYVLRHVPQTASTVSADDGYHVIGPKNDAGVLGTQVATVAVGAAGDLDGDGRDDLVVGYPDAQPSRSYSVLSPQTSQTISLTGTVAGQDGSRNADGAQGARAGASVAANTYGDPPTNESAQMITGAPGSLLNYSGAAYITVERDPVPAPDPTQTPGSQQQLRASGGSKPIGKVFLDKVAAPAWQSLRSDRGQIIVAELPSGKPSTSGLDVVDRKGKPGSSLSYFGKPFSPTAQATRCSWLAGLSVTKFSSTPKNANARCYGDHQVHLRAVASVIDCNICGAAATVSLDPGKDSDGRYRSFDVPLYRNVKFNRKSGKDVGVDKVPDADAKLPSLTGSRPTRVRWRYITKHGDFVLITYPALPGTNSAFISRSHLPHLYSSVKESDDPDARSIGMCGSEYGRPTAPRPPPGEKDNRVGDPVLVNGATVPVLHSIPAREPRKDEGVKSTRKFWPNVCQDYPYLAGVIK